MTNSSPILRGRFRFLRLASDDFERLFPRSERTLPDPHPIYPTDESSTPFLGFPILVDPLLEALRGAAQSYLEAEESAQVDKQLRQPVDQGAAAQAWRRYADLLGGISTRATASSYGRQYLSIFWLFHSIAVGRVLKQSPRRCRSRSPELTPDQTAEIKYRVFRRYADGISSATRERVEAVGERIEEPPAELYPSLLTRLCENVLILTEDHIGSDLKELDAYFVGWLGIDGRDFRRRMGTLKSWHQDRLRGSAELRKTTEYLVPGSTADAPDQLLMHPGYVSYLASLDGYDPQTLFSPEQVETWNRTLGRLKEFEILLAWRRLIVPVQKREARLRFLSPGGLPQSPGAGAEELAESTRALDFSTPSIIDPIVHRFGLVYDMANFAEIVSVLQQSGHDTEDESYRSIFEFQRWANRLAQERRVTMEKYLGDGALYSARAAEPLLAVAIRLQRRYASLVADGFPLDQGMRMALNFGSYRLVPLEPGGRANRPRFEFLGHGINELSRLVTGKSAREVEEIEAFLIGRGYAASEVEGFLAPLRFRDGGGAAASQRNERFSAHIDRNGGLVNEGIVATEPFLARLREPRQLKRVDVDGSLWIALTFEDRQEQLSFGVRKLGRALFKGLGSLEVFQLRDGADWAALEGEELPGTALLAAVRNEYRERTAGAR